MQKIKGMFYGALRIDLGDLAHPAISRRCHRRCYWQKYGSLNRCAAPSYPYVVSAAVEGERSDVTAGLPPVLLPPGSWTSEVCVDITTSVP